MGSIQHSKNQDLAASEGPKRSGKDKQKEKGKNPYPSEEKYSQFSEESSKPKGKKKNQIKLFRYFSKEYVFKYTSTQKKKCPYHMAETRVVVLGGYLSRPVIYRNIRPA